jgi:hypothetical protein
VLTTMPMAHALVERTFLAKLLLDPRFEFSSMTLHDDGIYQCTFKSWWIPSHLHTHQVCIAWVPGNDYKVYADMDT